MRIDIITVLPEMLAGFVHESILARAAKKGLAEIICIIFVIIVRTNGVVLMIILLAGRQEW